MIYPIRRLRAFHEKVTLLVTLVSGVAVGVVCLMLTLTDYTELRRQALESAEAHADMVSINSVAALMFEDPVHGAEALGSLSAARHVASAKLYDSSENVFARYLRDTDPGPSFSLGADRMQQDNWLVLTRPVMDRGQRYGQVQLVYDMWTVEVALWSGLLSSLAVTMAAMLLAYLVARRISGGLVKPIAELVKTATEVSRTRDYSIRAAKLSNDELGELTEAFNNMLAQIDQQAGDLREAYAERESLLQSERAARGEAERASRMKDDFVATLSHELRTPLTPILGWAQILRRRMHDRQTTEGLDVIERNARVQVQIIEDLLDMSRIVSGNVRLDVQRMDVAEVVEAAITTVRPAADARDIRLAPVIAPKLGAIRGDPGRVQQIVWNLLSNAIKFTGRGGRVEIRVQELDGHVEIVVADTGQGIPQEFLPHVFERFRQADSSTTRRHGGLGLGLAIVKQLVELHGGSVSAASGGENRGSTFTVTLPLIAQAGEAAVRREPARASRGTALEAPLPSFAHLRVLVVDDDPDARDLLARILQQCDASVLCASSAAEGLQLLQDSHPQVLISDIGMPVADGYEMIRKIRDLSPEKGGNTPAIALTAFARTEDRTRALLSGYQMHIAKPIEPAELIAAVSSVAGFVGAASRERATEAPSA